MDLYDMARNQFYTGKSKYLQALTLGESKEGRLIERAKKSEKYTLSDEEGKLLTEARAQLEAAYNWFEKNNKKDSSLAFFSKHYIEKISDFLDGKECSPFPTYSYHTFLYPFIIQKKKNDDKDNSFISIINTDDDRELKWEKDFLAVKDKDGNISICGEGVESKDQSSSKKWNYSAFQYFNRSAQKAVFSIDDKSSAESVVNCYKLKQGEAVEYQVKIKDNEVISLFINNIRFKIYNDTGIGVIIFETEYRPDDTVSTEEKRKNCKLINEFARRLYPPFLPEKANDFSLCPESTTISFKDGKQLTDEFAKYSMLTDEANGEYYINNTYKVPNIISGMLQKGYSDKFELKPAVDERMFVCCVIRDSDLVSELTDKSKHFLNDTETGKRLYSIINCDGADSSCQEDKFLKQCLEQQMYTRWEEWGTVHAVTNHSMFLLTSETESINSEVVYPFLTEYVQMCALVLVQRAGLLYFDEKINRFCNDFENFNDRFDEIMKDFSYFQGRIMLPEITSQIQGIELYSRVREMLFIKNLEDDINKQTKNLFEINEAFSAKKQKEADDKLSKIGYLISFLAIVSVIADLSDYMKKIIECCKGCSILEFIKPLAVIVYNYAPLASLVLIVAAVIVFFILKNKRKK